MKVVSTTFTATHFSHEIGKLLQNVRLYIILAYIFNITQRKLKQSGYVY